MLGPTIPQLLEERFRVPHEALNLVRLHVGPRLHGADRRHERRVHGRAVGRAPLTDGTI